jgi:integrase
MRRERVRLAPDELVSLIDQARDPRDKAFLAVAVNSALRSSEITALRLGDLDLVNGTLRVFRSKSQPDAVLRLTPDLKARLAAWVDTYGQELLCKAYDRNGEQSIEPQALDSDMSVSWSLGLRLRKRPRP